MSILRRPTCLPALAIGFAALTIQARAQTLQSPTINTSTATLAVKGLAFAAPNPGPSPLTSVTLSWSAHANATGYRVLRQAPTLVNGSWVYGPYVVVGAPSASVTSYTVTGLPPALPIQFRIVSVLSNGATDTTVAVKVNTPSENIATDTLPGYTVLTASPWPAPSSYGFAIMLKHACYTTFNATSITATWARNPAAARYRLSVAPGNGPSAGYSKLVSDTIANLPMLYSGWSGGYEVYGRPEFAIPNWPASGQTYYQPGNWIHFGQQILPATTRMTSYDCTE